MSHRPHRAPWRLVFPLMSGAAVVGFGLGFFVVRMLVPPAPKQASVTEARTPTEAAQGAEAAPAATHGVAPGASAASAQAAETDAAAAAPEADAAAAASDAGAPPSDAALAAAKPSGGAIEWSDAGLGRFEANLYVRSNAEADVWVQGRKLGKTNELLKLPCTRGLRFTRLGREPGPAWVSEARSIEIPCGQLTELELDPRPEKP